MRRKRQARGFIIVLALAMWAALLAGCSGSSDDSDSAPAANQAAPMEAETAKGEALSVSFGANAAAEGSGPAESAPAQASASTSQDAVSQGSALSAASIGVIADANAGFNRKMIYTANVVIKAKSFATAEEAVSNAIALNGGFIVQFADAKSESEIGSTYVIKVPSSGLSGFISQLEAIPNEDFDRKMQGSDVTEEYVDLASRLKAKQEVEARLLAFMDKATKADDLLKFSAQLGDVQEEIEQIKGRMRYLDQNVAYSTVNLRLYQSIAQGDAVIAGEEAKPLGEKLSHAMRASTNVLGEIGEGLLTFLAAILPVLLALAVIGGPIYWGVARTRGARREQAALRRKLLNAEPTADAQTAAEAPQAAPQKDLPEGGGD